MPMENIHSETYTVCFIRYYIKDAVERDKTFEAIGISLR